MNNEIKEILDKLKDENNYQVDCNDGSAFKELFANEINLLLDYITNLQEKLKVSQTNEETNRLEMQDITKILGLDEHTTFDEVKEYATNLQEEIEDLRRILGIWNNRKLIKKFNKEYDEEDKNKNPNRDYAAIYPDAEEVYKRYYDYKSRNEKAIEYLPEIRRTPSYELDEKIDNLENILQGEDKDVKDKR